MKTTFARAVAIALVVLLGSSLGVFAQGPQAQNPPAQAAASPKPAETDSGWDVVIYPVLAYIPLAGIDVTLPEVPPCTGCPPGVPTGSESGLSGAWFGSFRVEKGRFALAGDINYAGLRAERSTPFFDAEVSVIAGGATVGFEVAEGLFAEAGARYYELDLTARLLSFPEASWKPNTFQPMIGTTFRPQLAKRWRLYSHLDYTGFGGDATTVNGNARLEWRPIKFLALTAGYGFSTLRIDGEVGSKPIHLKYTLHGPIVGFGIPF
jgi:hypothetical protein